MSRTRSFLLVTALLCAAGLGSAANAGAAELFYGVDTQNRLVAFSSTTPTAISRVRLTGLQAGEQIVGLDVRPANRQLIGLSSASRLYRIDASGSATAVGTAPSFRHSPAARSVSTSIRQSTGSGSPRTRVRTCA